MIRENITYTDIEKTENGFEEVERAYGPFSFFCCGLKII